MQYENDLWNAGFHRIACLDEAGRGCLFGPVVAAAVILKPYDRILGVKDSKKLTPAKRETFFAEIWDRALAIGIGKATVEEIDYYNIRRATQMAMERSVHQLQNSEQQPVEPEAILVDAETIATSVFQQAVVRGEEHVHGIAAASIIAKVTRDRWCHEWHDQYPVYGLDRHKGYGTRAHRDAILTHGPSPLHRKSFLKKLLPAYGG